MDNLTYITGNYGKYIATKEKFERAGITIDYFKFEFEEGELALILFMILNVQVNVFGSCWEEEYEYR